MRALEGLSIAETGSTEAPLLGGLVRDGYAGVDVFFVISGFVMVLVTHETTRSARSWGDFLFARATRIFPVWWLFAGVMALYLFVSYGVPWDANAVAGAGNTGANHLLRSFLLLPQPNHPVLGVGWTLVHEMHFYLVFAFVLLFPRRWLVVLLAIWALVVTCGAMAGLSAPLASTYPQMIFYPMTLEFIAGGVAAMIFLRGWIFAPATCAVLGTVWLIAAMALYPDPTPFTLLWGRVLLFAPPVVLLIYGLAGLERRGRFNWAPGFLVALGNWSFSLYLSHMLTLSALRRIYPVAADIGEARLGLPTAWMDILRLGADGPADNLFFIVTGLIASTLVAAIAYYLFELPLLNRFRGLRKSLFGARRARIAEQAAP